MLTSGVTMIPICSNDDEFFRKCEEIRDKITELIGIDNPTDFVQATLDNDEDEFIMLEIEKIQDPMYLSCRPYYLFYIAIILYLFLHLFLIISLKHH